MSTYKKPLRERENPKDEAVRLASDPKHATSEYHPRYPHYEPTKQRTLDGEFVSVSPFKADKPTGKAVPIPNGGPDSKWPGIYPSQE